MLIQYTRTIIFNRLHVFNFLNPRRHAKLSTCLKTCVSHINFYSLQCSAIAKPSNSTKGYLISELETGRKDLEYTYAYKVLQTIPVNDKMLFVYKPSDNLVTTEEGFNQLLDHNWRSKTASVIVDAFKTVSSYCIAHNVNVSDTRFDKLVDGLMDHIQDLTDNELSDLLTCLATYPPCESVQSHNFQDVWSALDDVCCWRMNSWSIETKFWFADRWYLFNLCKLSDFMFYFLDKYNKRIEQCTKNQLLHLCVYNLVKRIRELPFEYHIQLDAYIPDMSLDEIAVVTRTLARNEIKPKLVSTYKNLIQKLKENLPGAHDIGVTFILQVLRYSSHVLLIDQLMDLLDNLVPEIDRLSIIACIHLALLGTTLQFFHKESLSKVSQKVVDNMDSARIKDLERILVPLTMFDFDPKTTPDIFKKIYEEIHTQERIVESTGHPRCLASTLRFLSYRNLYSHKLMDLILNPEYIVEIYGKNPRSVSHDIYALDISIDIDCPDYTGNRLSKEFRKKVGKWHVEYVPHWNQLYRFTMADKYLLAIKDAVDAVVPASDYIYVNHVLPNYVKPDIIICKDTQGNFVKPVGFEQYTLGDIMYAPDTNLKWYAIIALNWNTVIRGTTIPLGLYTMKARQLRKIGYEPILITTNEFSGLTKQEKINYIASKIR